MKWMILLDTCRIIPTYTVSCCCLAPSIIDIRCSEEPSAEIRTIADQLDVTTEAISELPKSGEFVQLVIRL
jgi:hypothetical protein